MLTGDFLFYHPDWVNFYIRITSPNEILLQEEKMAKIGNNIYLIDFLKYILVRDPQHRPSIDNILKRFEHIHAILVSNTGYTDKHDSARNQISNIVPFNFSLEGSLENYMELLFPSRETIHEKIIFPHKLKHVFCLLFSIY